MIIRTKGRPNHVTLRDCKLAVQFAADQLISSRMQANLSVTLRFDEDEFLNKKGWDGYCDYTDSNLKPREFVISAYPKLRSAGLYKVLLHEMVHVKQFAIGQMKEYVRIAEVDWMGQLHKDTRGDIVSSPWEQEALKLEKSLYKQFKVHLDSI